MQEKLNQYRNSFFSHPGRVSTIVGATSFFSLLIPTCIELSPLGKKERKTGQKLKQSQAAYDGVAQELSEIMGQVEKTNQSIYDLDCAMAGYPKYNAQLTAFQKEATSSPLLSFNKLKEFWNLQFDNDHSQLVTTQAIKEYDTLEPDVKCLVVCSSCGKHTCCHCNWIPTLKTVTHHYTEIDNVNYEYKNIISGSGSLIASLDCGYFSRAFRVFSPETYMTLEGPHSQTGKKEDGAVTVSFTRQQGSRVSLNYELDGKTVTNQIVVPRESSQANAANSLLLSLSQFSAAAIAAFNLTGANYNTLQNSLKQHFPLLLEQASNVNASLQQKSLELAEDQVLFQSANGDYKKGLSIWMPVFWLVPGTLSILTYVLVSQGAKFCTTRAAVPEVAPEETELTGVKTEQVVPAKAVNEGVVDEEEVTVHLTRP